ncbi:MAG: ferritin-like domain-containing protein [Acidobacteriota bacterium]|jgi:ferritin-like metal-binding protein YciE|nr:MAG: ferritin-like domain-containing protein [Acidobacteriota bacterium]
MASANLHELFVDEIRDLYHAEKQLTRALPRLAKNATSEELRTALEEHLEETKAQVERLERVFELLDERPRGKHCAGMAGIIEEAGDLIESEDRGPVLDAGLVAGAQRAEHYEMAAYGSVIAWANAMGHTEIAELLEETLEEEKTADRKLSAIATDGVNEAANLGMTEEEMTGGNGRARRSRSANGRAAARH